MTENVPSTILPVKQIEDYIASNSGILNQQISNLIEILDFFSTYSDQHQLVSKMKVALAILEISLLEVLSPRQGKSELLLLGDKIKLVYYLHIFYMLHYSKVLKIPGKAFQTSRENWIKITNTWEKYHKAWLSVRRNPYTKNISESVMRVCQPSLEGMA